jgi:hypothetical protein
MPWSDFGGRWGVGVPLHVDPARAGTGRHRRPGRAGPAEPDEPDEPRALEPGGGAGLAALVAPTPGSSRRESLEDPDRVLRMRAADEGELAATTSTA